MARQAAIFAAIGDPTRLRLLSRLAREGSPASLTTLRAGFPLTRQATAKHLAVLEAARLVSSAKAGRERRFALDPSALAPALTYLGRVAAEWDAARERLRQPNRREPDAERSGDGAASDDAHA